MLTNPDWVMDILEEYREPRMMHDKPGQFRERVRIMANQATMESPGDFLEIGAHIGLTTVILLELAEEHDRKVFVVDPWRQGTANCRGTEYQNFLGRIALWSERATIVRTRSDNNMSIEMIKDTKLCFALIDGLHKYITCLGDILNTEHSYLTVVDDTYLKEIGMALRDGAESIGRPFVTAHEFNIREGYILPMEK